MMDVYRSYYGLSGEPFRLGPDYRFSLHHPSYANAKAYLVYAIYQGEGFIAITGAPGTGKTTLISEILAGLDRHKIEVATLTSTQLESRDLLQMVASSFGLHPDKVEKPDLLMEIESFLVSRVRSGHRAILIVDEAQGLSPGALEELRLLANLQYQYQLLLQICLVGQDSLLKLIRTPGMEHLQQRLVAAAALEPLTLDETVDYIEHRLGRVGWKGDPSIDEAALRLVYQYSGGVPRRINLIANRLFLYGGMQQKHQMNGDDARAVIDGLIEEFLLPSEPPIAEADLGAQPPAGGDQSKPRYLPRTHTKPPGEQMPASGGDRSKADTIAPPVSDKTMTGNTGPEQADATQTRPSDFKLDSDNLPGSRRQPNVSVDRPRQTSPASSPAKGSRQPSFATRGDVPPARADDEAAERTRKQPVEEKKDSKGFFLFLLLLAGAGGAYLIDGTSVNLSGIYTLIGGGGDTAVQTEKMPDIAANGVEPIQDEPTRAEARRSDAAVEMPREPMVQAAPPPGDSSRIIRTTRPESVGGGLDATARPTAATPAKAAGENQLTGVAVAQQPAPATAFNQGSAVEAAAGGGQPARGEADDAGGNMAVAQISTPSPLPAAAVEAAREVADVQASPEPATSVAEPASPAKTAQTDEPKPKAEPAAKPAPPPTVAKTPKPVLPPVAIAANDSADKSADVIQAQRARLRAAAEKRFSEQVARAQDEGGATPVASTPPALEQSLVKAEPPAAPPAAKKKPGSTPAEVKKVLLDGRWTSAGKPATLLPSEITYCNSQVGKISCVSVPKNVKTQYGLALYKVETTLNGFSAEGLFEMSYRTLVKLVGSDSAEGKRQIAGADKDGWQISEYAMSCKLSDLDQISCVDGKGISRRYQRAGLAGR